MRSWLALLIGPMLMLAQQSASYALVTPACRQQTTTALEVIAGGSLLLILAFTLLAWRDWRAAGAASAPRETGEQVDGERGRARLLAGAGMGVGGISAVVSLMMWTPVWLLSPCSS